MAKSSKECKDKNNLEKDYYAQKSILDCDIECTEHQTYNENINAASIPSSSNILDLQSIEFYQKTNNDPSLNTNFIDANKCYSKILFDKQSTNENTTVLLTHNEHSYHRPNKDYYEGIAEKRNQFKSTFVNSVDKLSSMSFDFDPLCNSNKFTVKNSPDINCCPSSMHDTVPSYKFDSKVMSDNMKSNNPFYGYFENNANCNSNLKFISNSFKVQNMESQCNQNIMDPWSITDESNTSNSSNSVEFKTSNPFHCLNPIKEKFDYNSYNPHKISDNTINERIIHGKLKRGENNLKSLSIDKWISNEIYDNSFNEELEKRYSILDG